MPVARSDIRRTSLLRKFLSYDATFRDNLHRSLYGLPGFQVLTVTTSEERIATCVEVLRELPHAHDVAKRFLFAAKSAVEVGVQAPLLAMSWASATGKTLKGISRSKLIVACR